MGLNSIKSDSTWGKAASDINNNFTTVSADLEKVKNATSRNKGYFENDTLLKQTYQTAQIGEIAYVGTTYPYQIWKWNGSTWANSGATGGSESVNLNGYATKEELTELENKISIAYVNTILLETGRYLDINFSYQSYSKSKISEILRIPQKECKIINVWEGQSTGYGIVFLDKDFNFISGINPGNIYIWGEGDFDIPEESKYFIVQSDKDSIIIESDENIRTGKTLNDINEIEDKDFKIKGLSIGYLNEKIVIEEGNNGHYIDVNTGDVFEYSGASISNPIEVNVGDVFIFRMKSNESISAISKFDSVDGIYLPIISGVKSSDITEYIYYSKFNGFIVLSYENAFSLDCYKLNYDLYKNLESINSCFIESPYSKNLFNINDIINNYYIDYVTGILKFDRRCAISNKIAIRPDTLYHIHRTDIASGEVRFLDANGYILKPLKVTGEEYPNFNVPIDATIKSPSNAIYIQFTYKFRNVSSSIEETQLEEGSSFTGFEEYIKNTFLKESCLPKSIVKGNASTSPLYGKKILYNGDSICESRTSGITDNGGSYPLLISEKTGCKFENRAIGGGILASQKADGSKPSRTVVTDIVNMSSDADLICLEGGINDYWGNVPLGDFIDSDYNNELDETTLIGALESIIRQSINKWIGVPICFIIVHKIKSTVYIRNEAGYTFAEAHDKMVSLLKKYAIPFYDAFECSGLNAYNDVQNESFLTAGASGLPDGCHPNKDAYLKYYVPQLIKLFESLVE